MSVALVVSMLPLGQAVQAPGPRIVHETVDIGIAPASSHGQAENHTCGGAGPVITACSTGTHVIIDGFAMGLTATNYEGILENRITWLGVGELQEYTLRCEIDGALASCTHGGDIPAPGTTVAHTCRSLNATTELPGGEGLWTCMFRPATLGS